MSFLCNDAYNNGKKVTFYNVYCKEITIILNLLRNDDVGLITNLIGRLTVM